jgi:hypothetical protein
VARPQQKKRGGGAPGAPKKGEGAAPEVAVALGRRNYVTFAIGIVSIVIGYIALGQGSTTAAPLLLVAGYCVIVPLALLLK